MKAKLSKSERECIRRRKKIECSFEKSNKTSKQHRGLQNVRLWWSVAVSLPMDPPLLVIMPLSASSHNKSWLACVTNKIWQKWWHVTSTRLGYKRHTSFCSSLLSHLLWGKTTATLRNWGSPVERQSSWKQNLWSCPLLHPTPQGKLQRAAANILTAIL